MSQLAMQPAGSLYPVPTGTRPKLVPSFNEAGALRSLALDGITLVEHIAYNPKGQRTLMVSAVAKTAGTIDKRVLTRYAYDSTTFRLLRMRSELCTADASRNLTPLGNPLQDTGYLYDRAGNIWKQLERITDGGYSPTQDALDRLYTYDALYRLLSATGRETEYVKKPAPADVLWDSGPWDDKIGKAQGYKEEYQYDSVGFLKELKRTSFTSSGPQVHSRTYSGFLSGTAQVNNRLASVSYPDPSPMPGAPINVPYAYDSVGNCLSEGTERKYEWDHLGRLRSFRNQTSDSAEPTQYVHYLYDAAGQRVKKLNRKQKGKDWDATTYIDGLLELRHEQRSMAAKEGLTLHLMDGQKRLGRRRLNETFDKKPDNLLVLGDHLGSANVELDWEKGTLVDREEFRPYGETSFGSYELKRYRFTGKERDEESGLDYHGARYYAPGLGRWMSPDPKGTVDGVNLYCYTSSNPVNHVDPEGTDSQDAPSVDNRTKEQKQLLKNVCGVVPPPGASPDPALQHGSGPMGQYAQKSWKNPGQLPSRSNNTMLPTAKPGQFTHLGPIADRRPTATNLHPSTVSRVPSTDSFMRPDAAQAFAMMRAAAAADGIELKILASFRSLPEQISLWRKGYEITWNACAGVYSSQGDLVRITAGRNAIPGSSNHGGGVAVDIEMTGGVSTSLADKTRKNDPTYAWLAKNAARFGFVEFGPYVDSSGTQRAGEPWHWEYNPNSALIKKRIRSIASMLDSISGERAAKAWDAMAAIRQNISLLEQMGATSSMTEAMEDIRDRVFMRHIHF